ncbi:hypothetical protein Tco_0158663 [Tanacetum coccineum]
MIRVSEVKKVRSDQTNDSFWYKVLNEFNKSNFQKLNKDMLTKSNNKPFTHYGAWDTLKKHAKWDVADAVNSVDLNGYDELFGDDPRPGTNTTVALHYFDIYNLNIDLTEI